MPPSHRTGLNVARKRRKDGTTIEYFYDRASGKFLGHDRAAAEEARQRLSLTPMQAAGIQPGSINALILDYLQSEAFRSLRGTTQKLYRGYLDRMREDWGDIPARAITRQDVLAIRERLSATPRKANQVLSLLQILLGRARETGIVQENVAERFGRLHIASRTEIWSYQMEDAFLERARPALQLAYMLLLYTLQRPSDMLAMGAGRISTRDGRMFIALRQAKTGALLDVPVHTRLAPHIARRLDELNADEASVAQIITARIGLGPERLLVPSPTGKPWAHRNFARAWDQVISRMAHAQARRLFAAGRTKEEVRAELENQHRQRRDLRRTGIVRLAEAGATTPQIAAISGHGIDYCQRIIDTYLPRRTEVALAGMEVWEKHQVRETTKIVSIAASRGRLM
ncbi:tyrosine-type recombinase/integrase [Asaia sp. HumB]|uniref:tyrosine-type recombinase/integrase n=1 Tax=Asaia sp. HumB TaxID=3035475 RepID=UPI002554A537|nr:tyrosine-type recombinase/integrase [Asaia sp. HumB]MDL2172021.1 tyrosine-type recombinase/integrase [Asaia sp. HumB]